MPGRPSGQYPAARAAALRVQPHYAALGARPLPDIEAIEEMIDVAFWASLRREENITPTISLAFAAPEDVELALIFERHVPLAAEPLTKLGPAVERPGIHLCVARRDGELSVWGAAQDLPRFCFVLEVVAPGLLVVKHSRGDETGKYVNVVVLQGDEIRVVDQRTGAASLLGLRSEAGSPDSINVLTRLAVSMRAHGRGGALLVVPAESDYWQESIRRPIAYSVAPPFRALAGLMREHHAERSLRRWQDALQRAVEAIAGLTAVDGATIITDRSELLAFGAKIIRRAEYERADRVVVTEPIEGRPAFITDLGQLGGTRHLSAAQFAHDQRDALALVASQDGRFTVFRWSPDDGMVQASRVETLLL